MSEKYEYQDLQSLCIKTKIPIPGDTYDLNYALIKVPDSSKQSLFCDRSTLHSYFRLASVVLYYFLFT